LEDKINSQKAKQTSLKTQFFTFEFVELLLEAKKPKQTYLSKCCHFIKQFIVHLFSSLKEKDK